MKHVFTWLLTLVLLNGCGSGSGSSEECDCLDESASLSTEDYPVEDEEVLSNDEFFSTIAPKAEGPYQGPWYIPHDRYFGTFYSQIYLYEWTGDPELPISQGAEYTLYSYNNAVTADANIDDFLSRVTLAAHSSDEFTCDEQQPKYQLYLSTGAHQQTYLSHNAYCSAAYNMGFIDQEVMSQLARLLTPISKSQPAEQSETTELEQQPIPAITHLRLTRFNAANLTQELTYSFDANQYAIPQEALDYIGGLTPIPITSAADALTCDSDEVRFSMRLNGEQHYYSANNFCASNDKGSYLSTAQFQQLFDLVTSNDKHYGGDIWNVFSHELILTQFSQDASSSDQETKRYWYQLNLLETQLLQNLQSLSADAIELSCAPNEQHYALEIYDRFGQHKYYVSNNADCDTAEQTEFLTTSDFETITNMLSANPLTQQETAFWNDTSQRIRITNGGLGVFDFDRSELSDVVLDFLAKIPVLPNDYAGLTNAPDSAKYFVTITDREGAEHRYNSSQNFYHEDVRRFISLSVLSDLFALFVAEKDAQKTDLPDWNGIWDKEDSSWFFISYFNDTQHEHASGDGYVYYETDVDITQASIDYMDSLVLISPEDTACEEGQPRATMHIIDYIGRERLIKSSNNNCDPDEEAAFLRLSAIRTIEQLTSGYYP